MPRHKCIECNRRWSDEQKHRGDCPYCGAVPVGRGRGRQRKPRPEQVPNLNTHTVGGRRAEQRPALKPADSGKTQDHRTAKAVRKRRLLPHGISSSQQRWREEFAMRTGYKPRADGSTGLDDWDEAMAS